MILVLYLLSVVATGLAWTLARKRPEHKPIAVLLSIGLGTDLARRALRALYLGEAIKRLGSDTPWTGPERIAAIVSHALFLAWPAAMTGAALTVFLGRRAWPVVVAYAALITAIVIVHPIAGNGSLGRMLTAAQLASVAVSIGCGLTWYLSRSTKPTSTAQAALSLIVGVEASTIAFAWRAGIFVSWNLTQAVYVVLYVVLAIMQGGFVWQSSRSP
jgi:hypothetical protein